MPTAFEQAQRLISVRDRQIVTYKATISRLEDTIGRRDAEIQRLRAQALQGDARVRQLRAQLDRATGANLPGLRPRRGHIRL